MLARSPLWQLSHQPSPCLRHGGANHGAAACHAGAEPRGGSTNSGGGVAFAASAMLLVSAHRTVFSAAMPGAAASLGFDSRPGALQAAYLAGYGLTNAAGGAAADRVGGAKVLALCLVVWSSLVALTPAAASLGVAALALCRFGFGVASGPGVARLSSCCEFTARRRFTRAKRYCHGAYADLT